MAVYTLENVDFDMEGDRIIASADIMKDAALMQTFSISLKRTTDPAELGRAVASYAKNVVIHDTLLATTFVQAGAWLEQQSWSYG